MRAEESDEKQEAELDEFDDRQRRSFERGRMLVYLIVGVNLLFDIITIFITHEFEFLKFVVHVALSVALLYGVAWVRYLYAASGILTVVVSVMALPGLVSILNGSAGAVIIVVLLLPITAFSAATAVILLFNKSVQEYMYRKKSERL